MLKQQCILIKTYNNQQRIDLRGASIARGVGRYDALKTYRNIECRY